MEFISFISENMVIVSAALWVLGVFLKGSNVLDELIPWILVVIGLLISLWMNGINPDAAIQGVLVAGGAVLTDNLIKQTTKFVEKK